MEYMYEIVGDILDAVVLIFLYDVLMGKQYRVPKVFLFLIFITVNIVTNLGLGYVDKIFLRPAIWQIVFFALTFLYISKIYEKIIASVAFSVMGMAGEMIVVSIFSFMGEEQLVNEYYYMELMVSKLIVFIFIIIISLIYKRKINDRKYKFIFLLSLLISILELIGILYIMLLSTKEFIPQAGIVAVAVVVVNFILYMFVDVYAQMDVYKEREKLLEKNLRVQSASFEQLSGSYIQMRRILHDTNKHMKIIAGMIENSCASEALDYIDDTLGEINNTYRKCNTGNIVIDVMVSNLLSQCETNNIECKTEIVVDNNSLKINNRDMAIILGNLTENAVNYSRTLEEGNGLIDMAIIMNGNNLVIDIKNACFDPKADTKRNLGIENIERVVEWHSGIYTRKCEDNMYVASVIIPFAT